MSTCRRCGKVYQEPEDEQGEHPCPRCGYEWWEDKKEDGGEDEGNL